MQGTGSAPEVLAGHSSTWLIVRGGSGELLAASCVVPLVLESVLPGKWYYWAIPALCVAGVSLVVGLSVTLYGYRKDKRERALGYTTDMGRAKKEQDLYLLHPKTLEVVSAPYSPRPKSFRLSEMM
jgi:hypothetical protein